MILPNLHLKPTALDSVAHRPLRLDVPVTDWALAGKMNSMFVAAAEFGEACREFPIVFVRAGKEPDGTDAIAPVALFGLVPEENLYVEGKSWRARYMPAVLRSYPFCIARVDEQRLAICVDLAFAGVGQTGQPIFNDDGSPAELLKQMTSHLESLDAEIQRTRAVGQRLLQLGLLQDMRFDAQLPDGRQLTVDGFLTVDDKKVSALADAEVCELHRNGILGLLHLHWTSMGNVQRLVEWHVQRLGIKPAAAND
ncbi:MAG: SapC family protein [Burkholderiales bacterium]|nr:SapC family protein [Burkholderiales bacterium]